MSRGNKRRRRKRKKQRRRRKWREENAEEKAEEEKVRWRWWRWISTMAYMSVLVMAAGAVVVVVAFHFPLVGPAEFFDSRGNASETYHRRFANVLIVNGPQYYYCSSRIQPDDTCGLHCLYYF